jgi:hypothetical protein
VWLIEVIKHIYARWSSVICLGHQKNDLKVLLDIAMEIKGECAKHINKIENYLNFHANNLKLT